MSGTFFPNIECGKVDPSLSTLKRLATALGVTVSELVRSLNVQQKEGTLWPGEDG